MKKLWTVLLILLAWQKLISAEAAQTEQARQKPQQFQRTIQRAVHVQYLLFLPEGYPSRSEKRWPLILFLHGAGERGTNIDLVTVHGPPKIVKSKSDWPFIIVSPQCPNEERWSNETLLDLLDHVVTKHAVDTNRIYLTGLSMGGFGTWNLAMNWPERFAAMAPICGGGETISILLARGKKLAEIKQLPVWAFHGAKDPIVKVDESERMVNALRSAGSKNVKLTIYPEAGHDSWTQTYESPELYDWFLQHDRSKRELGRAR